jgi:hypothetical protein
VANQDWIHTSSSGSGNGTVNYTIDANAGAMRSGTITVGGQNFTVNQDGTIVQTNLVRRVAGGSVNGTAINSSAHTVTVAPGQSLSGAIKVEAVNSLASASIAPLGATVNWGDRTKQLWVVDGWIDTGTNIYTVPVNKTAPSTPGEYYLVVAFAGTYNLAQVMSATHPAREAIWNDGNDVAFDWNAAQFAEALANGGGTTIAWREPSGSGFYNDWLPCTAVKIVVTQTTQTNLVRRVAGGSVNGTAINSSAHTVTVAPGQSLSGAIKVEAVNSLASASIAPLGGDGELGRPDKAALGGRRMD